MTRIAVFASGRGSNCQAIQQAIDAGTLNAAIVLLVTDRDSAAVIGFAHSRKIPLAVIRPGQFRGEGGFSSALLEVLARNSVEWVVLAGYLKKIPPQVIREFPNRIVNIHPALLPAFGGKGMYGMHVHRAVWESGARVSGVTIHLVNDEYDAGPIVMQQAVDISECSTPDEVAGCVLELEHQLYPLALNMLFEHPLRVEGRRVLPESIHHD